MQIRMRYCHDILEYKTVSSTIGFKKKKHCRLL